MLAKLIEKKNLKNGSNNSQAAKWRLIWLYSRYLPAKKLILFGINVWAWTTDWAEKPNPKLRCKPRVSRKPGTHGPHTLVRSWKTPGQSADFRHKAHKCPNLVQSVHIMVCCILAELRPYSDIIGKTFCSMFVKHQQWHLPTNFECVGVFQSQAIALCYLETSDLDNYL